MPNILNEENFKQELFQRSMLTDKHVKSVVYA